MSDGDNSHSFVCSTDTKRRTAFSSRQQMSSLPLQCQHCRRKDYKTGTRFSGDSQGHKSLDFIVVALTVHGLKLNVRKSKCEIDASVFKVPMPRMCLINKVCINYRRILQKPYFHKYWTEIHDVTTIWKSPSTPKDATRIARAHQHRNRERHTRQAWEGLAGMGVSPGHLPCHTWAHIECI